MSLVQLIECTKCGFSQSIPYDGLTFKMPWEVWGRGCPKCGCSKVDVTVILEKTGGIRHIHLVGGAVALVRNDAERTQGAAS